MASKRFYINTDRVAPSAGFVTSYTDATQADPPVFTESDSFNCELHFLKVNPIPTEGQPFIYVDPASWPSVKFAAGQLNETPDAGTFILSSSLGGSTSPINFNAAASGGAGTVQDELQGLVGLTAATVTGDPGGPYFVDSQETSNPTLEITGNAAALAPDGSTVVIVKTQTANGSLTNRWVISLEKALPVLKTSGWTALPSASVAATLIQAGSATANKSYEIAWNETAIGGAIMLSVLGSGVTSTVGPIPFNASAGQVATAFAQHPDATGITNWVTVVQNGIGKYTVTFTGSNVDLSNTPTISTSSNTLIVPKGLQGVVTVSTAGTMNILNGDTSITDAVCEVEISESSGQIYTVAQVSDAIFLADLIGNTPGQATGNENYLTQNTGVNFYVNVTDYEGGSANDLDAVPTDDLENVLVQFLHATDGPRQFIIKTDSTPALTGIVIIPDDDATKRWLSIL